MSGGHYQYAEWKLEDLAGEIERGGDSDEPKRVDEFTSTRAVVGAFLRKAAKLVHEVEWADSGDTNYEDARKAIEAILKEPL